MVIGVRRRTTRWDLLSLVDNLKSLLFPMHLSNFWNELLRAVDTEPRQVSEICGASGLAHPVIALGVDNARRRLVVVSGDTSGRAAALAQADIQAAVNSFRVLFCRPVLDVFKPFRCEEDRTDTRDSLLSNSKSISTVVLQHALEHLSVVQQSEKTGDELLTVVREAMTRDDLKTGLCPIMLDDFSTSDIEIICSARNLDDTKAILQRLQMLQYFFPSPDQLALGLIDSGGLTSSRVLSDLEIAPQLGHPYAPAEITPETSLLRVVEALQEQGLAVEGEESLELTNTGKIIRRSVRFKPREGLVSKLLNRVSVTLSLKDLFGKF